MPMNTRDLWLVLRAQDQTNRALNAFTRNVRNAGDQVSSAHLQAQRAATMNAIANARLSNELARAESAQLAIQKSIQLTAIQQARLAGASRQVIAGMQAQVQAINQQILVRRQAVAATQGQIIAAKQHLQNIDQEIQRVNAMNKSMQDYEKGLSHLAGRMQSVGQTATAMGFALTVAGGAGLAAMGHLVQTSIDYEKQVRATATQVDGFNANLTALGDIGRRIAREIAVPFEQVQPALFDIFSSMEVGLEDAERLLKSFSKAAVAGGVEITAVSRATIGLLNAFQRPASDVNKILDAQFQLIQEGIGTYEEWNQRIGLVTPSAVRAGQSIEMMMAALAAATRMGISAARSGTSVARALDAISHPKTISNLSKLGVNVQDATGKFRPFNEILRDFRARLMSLPEKDRLSTMIEVFKGAGGTIEARRFLQNVLLGAGNLELFDTVLKEVEGSAGSMERAYGIMADGAAAKSQILKNNWMILKESLGTALTPAFIQITELLTNLIDKFNQLDPSVKRNIALAVLAATSFAAIVGPMLLLVGVLASIVAAFTVAGSAIAITVAALTSIIAILALATTGFILLYNSSDQFRNIVNGTGKAVSELGGIILGFLRDVKGSWDSQLGGPISQVANIIETKFLPATRSMQQAFFDQMLPKLREASRIIGDILGQAFQYIGWTISNIVVPALRWLGEWWEKNKSQLEPLFPILAQVAKWFAIIAAVVVGVLVAAFVGPLVAAVTAVIAAFALIGIVIVSVIKWFKFLYNTILSFSNWVKGALQAIGNWFVDAWNWIRDAVITAWNAVVNFLQSAWGHVVAAFQAGISWLRGVWDAFWETSLVQMVVAGFGALVAIIKLALAAIQFMFAWSLEALRIGWSAAWNFISNLFMSIWNGLVAFFGPVIAFIVALVRTAWTMIQTITVGTWNAITGAVSAAWNAITGTISRYAGMAWNAIQGAWNIARTVTVTQWNGIVNAIQGAWNTAWGIISGIAGRVGSAFAGAGRWLYNAGREIVQGLIDGLTSMFDRIAGAADRLAGIISDHMPGSPVKRGPLRVLNKGYAGGQIVKMLANGILAQQHLVADAMTAVGDVALAPTGSSSFINPSNAYNRETSEAAPKYITNNFNVQTNEIDPRRNAAELGWELQKVM